MNRRSFGTRTPHNASSIPRRQHTISTAAAAAHDAHGVPPITHIHSKQCTESIQTHAHTILCGVAPAPPSTNTTAATTTTTQNDHHQPAARPRHRDSRRVLYVCVMYSKLPLCVATIVIIGSCCNARRSVNMCAVWLSGGGIPNTATCIYIYISFMRGVFWGAAREKVIVVVMLSMCAGPVPQCV